MDEVVCRVRMRENVNLTIAGNGKLVVEKER